MAEAGGVKIIPKSEYFKPKEDGGLGYKREWMEMGKDQLIETDFPESLYKWRCVYETPNKSIEEPYFWLLNYMRLDLGFLSIEKITDVFSASEHSAFFGVAQQRIGLQQDKVVQYLATIGKMIKDLFQLVRELRIIDERIGYYKDSMDEKSKSRGSAEITLKGIWVDMVEGGSKNPGSVYGLARELQFTTLPDLFYAIHPKSAKDVDMLVDALDFNQKVKEVLKRKLRQFLDWKQSTFGELNVRRTFTVKYLRQHYDIINMYMAWVRPYLRNLRRLKVSGEMADSPDLVSAFEGSMMEVEVLAKFVPANNKKYFGCLNIHFDFRTRPSLNYQQEGYQRGPIHVGEAKIFWRFYAWTQEDIDNYKAMRAYEDFEMLSSIDSSVKSAMDALGTEMMNYLKEAGEQFPSKEQKKEELAPKMRLFGFLPPARPKKEKAGKPPKPDKFKDEKEFGKAKAAKGLAWLAYKNFKQSHGLATW